MKGEGWSALCLREVLEVTPRIGDCAEGWACEWKTLRVGMREPWLFFAEICRTCQGSAMATSFVHMKNDISKSHPRALLSPRRCLRRRALPVSSQLHLVLAPLRAMLGGQVRDAGTVERTEKDEPG